jgi:hypothetical protein
MRRGPDQALAKPSYSAIKPGRPTQTGRSFGRFRLLKFEVHNHEEKCPSARWQVCGT